MKYRILRPCLWFAKGDVVSYGKLLSYYTPSAIVSLTNDRFVELASKGADITIAQMERDLPIEKSDMQTLKGIKGGFDEDSWIAIESDRIIKEFLNECREQENAFWKAYSEYRLKPMMDGFICTVSSDGTKIVHKPFDKFQENPTESPTDNPLTDMP